MTDIGLYSLDSDNVVVFSFKNIGRLVSGPEEALQVVASHLFSSPGSNTYDREQAGGVQDLVSGHSKSTEEVATDAAIILNRTQASILRTQSREKPADATITGLRLFDVNVGNERMEIAIKILIELLDGNSFQATFRVT